MERTSYFSQAPDSSGLSSFSLLQLDLRSYSQERRYLGWGVNSGVAYIADSSEPLLRLNEVYLSTTPRFSTTYEVSVGRKFYHWSQMDSDWRLGLWQPRFMWDYLNPEVQGLTGAFFRVVQPEWEFMVLVAPMFIPEQGAPLRNDNGRIVSSSRWISQPQNRVRMLDADSPLNYYVNVPNSTDVINNPGGAASLRIGDRTEGAWTQFSYALKPVNQLLLAGRPEIRTSGREPFQAESVPDQAQANVIIYPRVIYHQLMEASTGYTFLESSSFWVSALSEQPIMDTQPPDRISQQLGPMFMLSPGVSHDLSVRGPTPTRLKASVLKQWGGDLDDSGELANPGRSVFQPRYPFRNAAQLELQAPLFWTGQQVVSIMSRVIYEWQDQGLVLTNRLSYRPTRTLDLILGADLLGQWGGGSSSTASFGARYRGNDRVYGGIQYVF